MLITTRYEGSQRANGDESETLFNRVYKRGLGVFSLEVLIYKNPEKPNE
jgi:hypothetical protein